MINYMQLNLCDSMNGPGLRVSVFVSGCTLKCKGCFNPESHEFTAGRPLTSKVTAEIADALGADGIQGISILGGDPLEPGNIWGVIDLLNDLRWVYRDTKDVWLWTGRTLPAAKRIRGFDTLARYVDVIVDGPFIQELADPSLKYRGSSNQKLWRVKHDHLGETFWEMEA